jgi:hypothetical protein
MEKRFLKHQLVEDEPEQLFLHSTSSELPTFPMEEVNDAPFDRGYATNQDGVVLDMLKFLHKFYEHFPEKRKADLYLASESYGGNSLYDNSIDIKENTFLQ